MEQVFEFFIPYNRQIQEQENSKMAIKAENILNWVTKSAGQLWKCLSKYAEISESVSKNGSGNQLTVI